MSETVSGAVEKTGSDVSALLAQLARLDNRPETITAMQHGLDEAWAALERASRLPEGN